MENHHKYDVDMTDMTLGANEAFFGWWFGTFGLSFHSVGNVIIPTDELIFFQRGRSTTNQ